MNILPRSEYQDLCPITLEPLFDLAKKNELVMTSCFHKFSGPHLAAWFEEKRRPICPMCQIETDSDTFPVALKADRVAEKRLPGPKAVNGDLSDDEALKIALKESCEEKKQSETLKSVNGDLKDDEALKIALQLG